MSEPLSLSERIQLIAELDSNPPPHPILPATPGPGRLRVSEHDHRLALESEGRRGQRRA